MKYRFALLLLLLTAVGVHAAPPENVWITLDQTVLALLRGIDPSAQSVRHATVPTGRRTALGFAATDTVHVLSVDRALLPTLSRRVHTELHHCGGYVVHDSFADALAVLGPKPAALWATVPSYAITQQTRVTPMLAQVDGTEIESTIAALSSFHNRFYDSSYGAAASDWLAAEWTAMAAGRADVHVTQVPLAGASMASVVLTIEGSDLAEQVVILGGHLDSINYEPGWDWASYRAPGADDDASGIAGLTEVLRVLLGNAYKPQRTLSFMAFSGEERGLLGSKAIANDYAANQIDVVGMLQLDMTLYKGSAADIYLINDYTSAEQNEFLFDLAEEYLPSLSVAYTPCGYACSDHDSWTQAGYRASFPYESVIGGVEDYPYIHTANDTWANADAPGPGTQADHALKFTRLALAYAVELAGQADAIFADGFEPAAL